MQKRSPQRIRLGVAVAAALGLVVAPLAAVSAVSAAANTGGTGVVINEAYLNGGSAGASYLNKFVELYNPSDAPISLASYSLQYRSPRERRTPPGFSP